MPERKTNVPEISTCKLEGSVPFHDKPPEVVKELSDAIAQPTFASVINGEVNNLYRDSLQRLGLPSDDVEQQAEAFKSMPLTLEKVEVAYGCRTAVDRIEKERIRQLAPQS